MIIPLIEKAPFVSTRSQLFSELSFIPIFRSLTRRILPSKNLDNGFIESVVSTKSTARPMRLSSLLSFAAFCFSSLISFNGIIIKFPAFRLRAISIILMAVLRSLTTIHLAYSPKAISIAGAIESSTLSKSPTVPRTPLY